MEGITGIIAEYNPFHTGPRLSDRKGPKADTETGMSL